LQRFNASTLQRLNDSTIHDSSHCRSVMANELVQPPGNLAQRAVFHGFNQLREDIAAAFDDAGEVVESRTGLGAMAPFERLETLHLKLLPLSGRADDLHAGKTVIGFVIAIEPDEGPRAIIDLLLVTMRRGLDLASLVAVFDGAQHAADAVDLPELRQ